jgi:hypothetical protein
VLTSTANTGQAPGSKDRQIARWQAAALIRPRAKAA